VMVNWAGAVTATFLYLIMSLLWYHSNIWLLISRYLSASYVHWFDFVILFLPYIPDLLFVARWLI
jgi:hypothetical protein